MDQIDIPLLLNGLVNRNLALFLEAVSAKSLPPPSSKMLKLLEVAFAKSDFIAQTLIRYPRLFQGLLKAHANHNKAYFQNLFKERLTGIEKKMELESILRRIRREVMLSIAWRDLLGLMTLRETIAELSDFANVSVNETLIYLHNQACVNLDLDPATVPHLIIVSLGKLGGEELNFSSDIDLLFAFSERHELREPWKFYDNIAKELIALLHRVTSEGYVFRVDMRLRPFGDSGALVLSLSALQDYYENHGRDWERYAMIKASILTGSLKDREKLGEILQSFSYRPYVDYSMQTSVRHMKTLLMQEEQRKGRQDNIKLGRGGIREIEFIVQSLQLIHGGKLPALQSKSFYQALAQLQQYQYIEESVAKELAVSYEFLRQLEHKLQMLHDQQTHDLPKNSLDQCRIAYAMGASDWQSLLLKINAVRKSVNAVFTSQLAQKPLSVECENKLISADALTSLVNAFWQKYRDSDLSSLAIARLNALLPILHELAAGLSNPAATLSAALSLLESIVRRSAYVSLLLEKQILLKPLLTLLAKSPWLLSLLRQYPALLAELADKEGVAPPLEGKALREQLNSRLAHISIADTEKYMEELRLFKLAHSMRIAIADLEGKLSLMRVSDHLSDLAVAILEALEKSAWQVISSRFGFADENGKNDHGFVVIAYGKLGGIELSYSSDLDLVFLYSDEREAFANFMSASEFYVKLAQRLVYLLQTKTYSGALYEVDLRLRPSGSSGLLVSSLRAYCDYQLKEAWIWEHQALLRARVVAGSKELAERFAEIRLKVLCQSRDGDVLRTAVVEMRDKMRAGQKKAADDLKHGAGGLIDIEFLVQYIALRYAALYPQLVEYTDNIRILEAAAKVQVLSVLEANELIEAYKQMRALLHHQLLRSHEESYPELNAQREFVQSLWHKYLINQ